MAAQSLCRVFLRARLEPGQVLRHERLAGGSLRASAKASMVPASTVLEQLAAQTLLASTSLGTTASLRQPPLNFSAHPLNP